MIESLRRLIAALALTLFLIAPAWATPRIGLVTMAPGEVYWSRFGHNAILVEQNGQRTLYNYGYFDFDQPDFLTRFLQGKMRYQLVALPFELDLQNYREEGRGAVLQWLDLPESQARALADFLAWNAQPENAYYRYDYFTDNCSTRVRDALDRALGGVLQRTLTPRSRGLTYRSESLRLSADLSWLALGMHLGLGPFADRVLTRWDEAFLPEHLAEAVREVRIGERPLVIAEEPLLPHRLTPAPKTPPRYFPIFAAIGIGTGLAMYIALTAHGRRTRTGAGVLTGIFWLVTGVGGLLLAALWLATDHTAAWRNHNLLLLDPLALLLLPCIPGLVRGRRPGSRCCSLAAMLALIASIAVILQIIVPRGQDQADWIALLLPIHAAIALALQRRRTEIATSAV